MALVVFYPLPCSLLSSIPHPLLPSLVSTRQKQTLLLLFLRPKPPFSPFPRRKQSVRVREKGFASLEAAGEEEEEGPSHAAAVNIGVHMFSVPQRCCSRDSV